MNIFSRRAAAFNNDMRRSCGALLGIVQGILADGALMDQEVKFLRDWLEANEVIANTWPADVVLAQVREVLSDGIITRDERTHLQNTLQQLVGGTLDELAQSTHVTELPLAKVEVIDFAARRFCLTGDFVFGPRKVCEDAIARRGGVSESGITKKLNYVIVGGLGSPEWKHGSFGTKIEKAVDYSRAGVPLLIVHEDIWAASLNLSPVLS